MTFDEYQEAAHKTAVYPSEFALAYVTMGLIGEAGEIANKVKKFYRDFAGNIDRDDERAIAQELGDVLWYVAEFATVIGWDLSDVAGHNIAKLQSRQERRQLGGSGDNR